jgi:hypothetical protein
MALLGELRLEGWTEGFPLLIAFSSRKSNTHLIPASNSSLESKQ